MNQSYFSPTNNQYETPYTTMGEFRNFSREIKAVEYDYDLPARDVKVYLEQNESENGEFAKCFKEYENSLVNINNATFSNFLQYCSDSLMLDDNKELYAQIVKYLDYAVSKNLMHKERRENNEKFLNKALFQNNANYVDTDNEKYEALDFSLYEYNNFRETTNNFVINEIHSLGGAIYLNSDAKISCRFSKENEFKGYSYKQAKTILSVNLKSKIKITEEPLEYQDIDMGVTPVTLEAVVL